MLQRIQSLYLLIAAILTGISTKMIFASLSSDKAYYELIAAGIKMTGEGLANEMVYPTMPLRVLVILSTVISAFTIFRYKKRKIQISLCSINIAITLGITGIAYYYGYTAAKVLEAKVAYHLPLIIPVVSAILIVLALIAIIKDEALVKSFNRIR